MKLSELGIISPAARIITLLGTGNTFGYCQLANKTSPLIETNLI